jgi:hypothetical protein
MRPRLLVLLALLGYVAAVSDYCRSGIDIAFIVDSRFYQEQGVCKHIDTVKSNIKEIVGKLSNQTRIAIYQFTSEISVDDISGMRENFEVALSYSSFRQGSSTNFSSIADIEAAVDDIVCTSTGDKAHGKADLKIPFQNATTLLQSVQDVAFGVQAVVLFTDGGTLPYNDVYDVTSVAGIGQVALGLGCSGGFNCNQLAVLATEENFFDKSDDYTMKPSADQLLINLCPTVAPTASPTGAPTAAPSESPGPTLTPTPDPSKAPTIAPSFSPTAQPTMSPTSAPTPCDQEADFVFLIDGTASVGADNFENIKQFVQEFANGIRVDPTYGSQIAVLQFGGSWSYNAGTGVYDTNGAVTEELALDDGDTSKISRITYQKYGSTNIGYALNEAYVNYLNNSAAGARSKTYLGYTMPKVIFVITDGISADEVSIPADIARANGVLIYVIGVQDPGCPSNDADDVDDAVASGPDTTPGDVGNGTSSPTKSPTSAPTAAAGALACYDKMQLLRMASQPSTEYGYFLQDFDIVNISIVIQNKLCEPLPTPPPTPVPTANPTPATLAPTAEPTFEITLVPTATPTMPTPVDNEQKFWPVFVVVGVLVLGLAYYALVMWGVGGRPAVKTAKPPTSSKEYNQETYDEKKNKKDAVMPATDAQNWIASVVGSPGSPPKTSKVQVDSSQHGNGLRPQKQFIQDADAEPGIGGTPITADQLTRHLEDWANDWEPELAVEECSAVLVLRKDISTIPKGSREREEFITLLKQDVAAALSSSFEEGQGLASKRITIDSIVEGSVIVTLRIEQRAKHDRWSLTPAAAVAELQKQLQDDKSQLLTGKTDYTTSAAAWKREYDIDPQRSVAETLIVRKGGVAGQNQNQNAPRARVRLNNSSKGELELSAREQCGDGWTAHNPRGLISMQTIPSRFFQGGQYQVEKPASKYQRLEPDAQVAKMERDLATKQMLLAEAEIHPSADAGDPGYIHKMRLLRKEVHILKQFLRSYTLGQLTFTLSDEDLGKILTERTMPPLMAKEDYYIDRLKLRIIGATNLLPGDFNILGRHSSDPFVVVSWGRCGEGVRSGHDELYPVHEIGRTCYQKQTLVPRWSDGEEFELPLNKLPKGGQAVAAGHESSVWRKGQDDNEVCALRLDVYDHDIGRSNDLLGSLTLDETQLIKAIMLTSNPSIGYCEVQLDEQNAKTVRRRKKGDQRAKLRLMVSLVDDECYVAPPSKHSQKQGSKRNVQTRLNSEEIDISNMVKLEESKLHRDMNLERQNARVMYVLDRKSKLDDLHKALTRLEMLEMLAKRVMPRALVKNEYKVDRLRLQIINASNLLAGDFSFRGKHTSDPYVTVSWGRCDVKESKKDKQGALYTLIVHSLIHSLMHSLVHSLIHSCTLSYTLSHTLSLIHSSHTLPLIHSLSYTRAERHVVVPEARAW